MSEEKYYVIIDGNDRKLVFGTWNKVKSLAQGHKVLAFNDKAEAEYYVEHGTLKINDEIKKRIKLLNSHEAIIFTDGSYSDLHPDVVGAGAVVIHLAKDKDGKLKPIEERIKATGDNPYLVHSRNVGGEILAVTKAVSWAADHGFTNLHLYHDYVEVGKWATGEHKANLDLTKTYRDFMHNLKDKGVEVKFQHVYAHHGVYYNDIADDLARSALDE